MSKNPAQTDWHPSSWRDYPAAQQPAYADGHKTARIEEELRARPSLVSYDGIRELHDMLAKASTGESFIIQGGDCAESFSEGHEARSCSTLALMRKIGERLSAATNKNMIYMGRMAGQCAKPRSHDSETRNGLTLPVYRGDAINSPEFTAAAREHDPVRMLRAYDYSAATLRTIRDEFKGDLFTCHEALLLPYEQALVRHERGAGGAWYASSAHFLWLGARTAQTDGAHTEFLRGIVNPIGIKCAPDATAQDVIRLIGILNPSNLPGRISLITRFGRTACAEKLPLLIKAVKNEGLNICWICDPMHGNTIRTPDGGKTRHVSDILSEITDFFAIHRAEGTHASGIHLELTGEDVEECAVKRQKSSHSHKEGRYLSPCDPRLNKTQSIEVASVVAKEIAKSSAVMASDAA